MNRTLMALVVLALVSLGGTVALSGCKSCMEGSFFGAVLGEENTVVHDRSAHEVWICPGEAVTLGWALDPKFKAADISPEVGDLPDMHGLTTVRPQVDTQYTLHASNSCSGDMHVHANVVEAGDKTDFEARQVIAPEGVAYYEKELEKEFYSPSIIVTSARIEEKTGWRWNVQKTNLDGYVINFTVTDVFSSTWGGVQPQLAGYWKLWPQLPAGQWTLPINIHVEVTMKCK